MLYLVHTLPFSLCSNTLYCQVIWEHEVCELVLFVSYSFISLQFVIWRFSSSDSQDGAWVDTSEGLLDWRTGGASFSGRVPAMENQGLPLSMDSKFNFHISNDVLNTICDLESRPNLTFSRKGRGDRTETASTSCKVAKLSSWVGSEHSENGELSSGSRTPGTGDGGGTSESDDMSTKGLHQDVKCKRYKRTQEALQSSGLLDVTMKTAELIKRNRQLQKDIQDFKKETVEFLKSVLKNPENKEYAKVIHGKTSTS